MRAVSLAAGAVALIAAALPIRPADAYPVYPWCAFINTFGGMTNCYYSEEWQCRQALLGNGGYCYENPFYTAAPPPPQKRARRSRDR